MSLLLRCHCSPSTSQIFLVSMLSLFWLFRCFPIPSEPVLLPLTSKTFLHIHSTQAMDSTINHSIQLTRAETVIYLDNSPWHKPLHIPNMAKTNLCHLLIRDMNHYTYVSTKPGKAVIYAVDLSMTWTITSICMHGKSVIYAVKLSMTWTITHTKYGIAVNYAVNLSWQESLQHTLVWKHSDQCKPYKEYGWFNAGSTYKISALDHNLLQKSPLYHWLASVGFTEAHPSYPLP